MTTVYNIRRYLKTYYTPGNNKMPMDLPVTTYTYIQYVPLLKFTDLTIYLDRTFPYDKVCYNDVFTKFTDHLNPTSIAVLAKSCVVLKVLDYAVS